MLHNIMVPFFPWLIEKDKQKEIKNEELILPLYEDTSIYVPKQIEPQEEKYSTIIIEIL